MPAAPASEAPPAPSPRPVPPPLEKASTGGFPRNRLSNSGKDLLAEQRDMPSPNLVIEGIGASKSNADVSSPAASRGAQPTKEPAAASNDPAQEIERLRKLVHELQHSNESLKTQMREVAAENAMRDGPLTTSAPLLRANTMAVTPTASRTPVGHANEVRALRQSHEHARRHKRKSDRWDAAAGADEDAAAGNVATPKTEEQRALILAALKQRAPFDSLSDELHGLLIEAMILKTAKAGEVLITEGDEKGQNCYLLNDGELEVTIKGKQMAKLAKGNLFGEVSLFYNVPRTATVTATTDATFFALHRGAFQATLREETIARRLEVFTFLRSCDIFTKMGSRDLSRVADVVQPKSFKEGTVIVREGEMADGMYFVRNGQVVVKQLLPDDLQGPEGKDEKMIGILKAGEYFGERGLLTDDPRSASVEAVTDAVCLRIDRESFLKLLNPVRRVDSNLRLSPISSTPVL